MHIALLTPAWPGTATANGITTSVSRLRSGLRLCGHKVTIIANRIDAAHDDEDVFALSARPWSIVDKLRWRLGDEEVGHRRVAADIVSALDTAQRQLAIDVFVMEESFGWAYWLSGKVSMPIVVTLRGPWCLHKAVNGNDLGAHARRENLEAAALQVVQGITAPSRDVLEAARHAYGFPEVPQAVIPNAVPVENSMRSAKFDSDRMRRLLFVGRYDRHKGGDTVLDMFRTLAVRKTGCTLTFVGPDKGISLPDGGIRGIDAHVASFPELVRSRVTILGQQNKPEVESLRGSHGITIVASRYEVFGNVVIEAMAFGAPIVCTRVGGPAEILRHEETALLVPPDDPEAMAGACMRLLDDPEMASRLGRAAQECARKEFQPAAVGERMAVFLEQVVARHSRSK